MNNNNHQFYNEIEPDYTCAPPVYSMYNSHQHHVNSNNQANICFGSFERSTNNFDNNGSEYRTTRGLIPAGQILDESYNQARHPNTATMSSQPNNGNRNFNPTRSQSMDGRSCRPTTYGFISHGSPRSEAARRFNPSHIQNEIESSSGQNTMVCLSSMEPYRNRTEYPYSGTFATPSNPEFSNNLSRSNSSRSANGAARPGILKRSGSSHGADFSSGLKRSTSGNRNGPKKTITFEDEVIIRDLGPVSLPNQTENNYRAPQPVHSDRNPQYSGQTPCHYPSKYGTPQLLDRNKNKGVNADDIMWILILICFLFFLLYFYILKFFRYWIQKLVPIVVPVLILTVFMTILFFLNNREKQVHST